MQRTANSNSFSSETRILFWPSFVDMLITTLMTILLVYFLQTVFNDSDLETLRIRQQQQQFESDFKKKFSVKEREEKIAIVSRFNLILITFNNEVLFGSGNYQLQPQGKEILGRVAELFKNSNSYSLKQIQVEGHTDDDRVSNRSGYPSDNWELSTGRAISVVRYLIEGNQSLEKLISANGYAQFRPVADNSVESGKAKNRRIEILIFFSTPGDNKK